MELKKLNHNEMREIKGGLLDLNITQKILPLNCLPEVVIYDNQAPTISYHHHHHHHGGHEKVIVSGDDDHVRV